MDILINSPMKSAAALERTRIRMASREDAEEVARVINAAFVVERVAFDGDRTNPGSVRELLDKGTFLVAEAVQRRRRLKRLGQTSRLSVAYTSSGAGIAVIWGCFRSRRNYSGKGWADNLSMRPRNTRATSGARRWICELSVLELTPCCRFTSTWVMWKRGERRSLPTSMPKSPVITS
jgi:hypothetical protein